VTVLTHRRPGETALALESLRAAAARAGAVLLFDADETAKHRLSPAPGIEVDAPIDRGADLCVTLGGDGTILRGLREYADTGVPVFAVNFGEIGFLATVEPDDAAAGFARAFAGEFETLSLPGISLSGPDGAHIALNDVSVQRQHGGRVAQLAYAVGAAEVGRVRCDGLVVATPAGSTGYNLANGGPVLAWGVEGYVVSFIAPHSLTARALVVAPDDVMEVRNCSLDEPVDVSIDGRPVGTLGPGEAVTVGFRDNRATLAQLPGASFYQRVRTKFGHLAGLDG
jgi:NAD+ kinase